MVVGAIVVGQRDVLRFGILLVTLPIVSLLVAVRSRIKLAADRSVEPPRVTAGERATVSVHLANLSRSPTGVLLVEDTLPYTLGGRPRFVLDRVWAKFRRQVTYQITPALRGRYTLGPLTIRITDPFGMIELQRSFSETSTLIVTPPVIKLATVRLMGEWSGSGESRPRAIASAGEEDATIRPYRHGDDMRRVHWRATAHHDQLMVRREEQPWQSRATILLDNRVSGHAGEGVDSSFEWAVTAAASVGVHLTDRGYAVRMVTDHGGSVSGMSHDAAAGPVSAQAPLLDALAVVGAERRASLGQWQAMLGSSDAATGLLVGVFGRLRSREATVVADLRHGSTAALAVLVDVASWTSAASSGTDDVQLTEVTQILRRAGWRVITVGRGENLATAWEKLGLERISHAVVGSGPGPASPSGAAVADPSHRTEVPQ
jgi:uncharacterized protein (DUF58 family)